MCYQKINTLIKTETEKKDTMVRFSISALKRHSYFSELIITKNNGNVIKKTYIPDSLWVMDKKADSGKLILVKSRYTGLSCIVCFSYKYQ